MGTARIEARQLVRKGRIFVASPGFESKGKALLRRTQGEA